MYSTRQYFKEFGKMINSCDVDSEFTRDNYSFFSGFQI